MVGHDAELILVAGAGAFPDLTRPRVFWAGVQEPSGVLNKLAQSVEDEIRKLGFEPEAKKFRPHLTVGRVKGSGKNLESVKKNIGDFREKSFGNFTAEEIVLFKSDLRPGGAVYTRLETAPLKK